MYKMSRQFREIVNMSWEKKQEKQTTKQSNHTEVFRANFFFLNFPAVCGLQPTLIIMLGCDDNARMEYWRIIQE